MRTPPGGFTPGSDSESVPPPSGGEARESPSGRPESRREPETRLTPSDRRRTLSYEERVLAQTEPPQPDAHVQAAIEASTRAEANLSSLLRAIQEASSGVSGVREANDRLAAELRRVREILSVVNERRMMLERRIAMLEDDRERSLREVDQARLDATRDRAFLVEEQDRFLSSMLEDHEKAIAALRRERDDAREKAVRMTSGLLGIERPFASLQSGSAGSGQR